MTVGWREGWRLGREFIGWRGGRGRSVAATSPILYRIPYNVSLDG